MILSLDFSSDVPIYQQIRNQVVMEIANGGLEPGERLPTIRNLAEEAGINTMTVNKAYQLLKQEGYIYADRRSGARVCEQNGGNTALVRQAKDNLALALSEAKAAGMEAGEALGLCRQIFNSGLADGKEEP